MKLSIPMMAIIQLSVKERKFLESRAGYDPCCDMWLFRYTRKVLRLLTKAVNMLHLRDHKWLDRYKRQGIAVHCAVCGEI